MKKVSFFILGAISCLILSHTFSKNEAPETIITQNSLSSVLFVFTGNELTFNIPENAKVNYTCAEGTVIRSSQNNKITLIPNFASQEVMLNIDYNGKTYTQKYHSVALPDPVVEIKSNGKPLDLKIGMLAPGPAEVTINVNAHPLIKQFYPKDARYTVSEWNALLVRGKRPVAQQRSTTETVDLSSFKQYAQSGDRLLIEIMKIKHVNFQGRTEDLSHFTLIYNLPLN